MLSLMFKPVVTELSNPDNLIVDYIKTIGLSSFSLGAYDIEPEQGFEQPTILSFIALLNNSANVQIVGYKDLEVVSPTPVIIGWTNFNYEIIIDISGDTSWGGRELGDANILSVGVVNIRTDNWLQIVKDFMVKMGFVQDNRGWFERSKLFNIIFMEV